MKLLSLIIRILIPHITHKFPGGLVPPFEMLACNASKTRGQVNHLRQDKLDIFLGHISNTPILHPGQAN